MHWLLTGSGEPYIRRSNDQVRVELKPEKLEEYILGRLSIISQILEVRFFIQDEIFVSNFFLEFIDNQLSFVHVNLDLWNDRDKEIVNRLLFISTLLEKAYHIIDLNYGLYDDLVVDSQGKYYQEVFEDLMVLKNEKKRENNRRSENLEKLQQANDEISDLLKSMWSYISVSSKKELSYLKVLIDHEVDRKKIEKRVLRELKELSE